MNDNEPKKYQSVKIHIIFAFKNQLMLMLGWYQLLKINVDVPLSIAFLFASSARSHRKTLI